MCGRYTLVAPLSVLEERFQFSAGDLAYQPRYNIAPTLEVLTVARNGERRGQLMRWGFIPSWAKDPKAGAKMINARAEGLMESPVFRPALTKRRCLVLADGFYEWRKEGKERVPLRYVLKSREPFAFAGVWAVWKDPSGKWLRSCAIITTNANDLVAKVHDRMPVVLSEEAERIWLDPASQAPQALLGVLTPFPGGSMDGYEVSPLVNSVKNEGPEMAAPVAKLPGLASPS